MLKIAIQKSGRLSEGSMQLLKDCGIHFSNGKKQLITPAINFPVQVYYLRDDDIPKYVEGSVADVGMVGENVVYESGKKIKVIKKLGFSKCRVALAVPKNAKYNGPADLQGKRIATTYVNILKDFLAKEKVQADIHPISGSVEIAPGIGLADAIMDIVSTGSTLLSNGLKEVKTVLKSEAVLVGGNSLSKEKNEILDKLLFRMDAVQKASGFQYILLNAPNENVNEIVRILPGMKSPTVLPLAQVGWSSIHSVINEKQFWEIIDHLKDLGAQGILTVPIGKMII